MSTRPLLRPVEDMREPVEPRLEGEGDDSAALQPGPQRYLLLSQAEPHVQWLERTLWEQGRVLPLRSEAAVEALDAQIARQRPQALFLDFCTSGPAMQAMPKALERQWPALPVIGLGRAGDPSSMLAALRAGVHDFVDMDASADEAQAVLAAVLARRPAHRAHARGQTVALLGARSGLGVSTLAASLSLVLQGAAGGKAAAAEAQEDDEVPQGVALLDLGLPVRDSLLYLDSESSFSFVDGVRNLRRLDRTLVHSALARHASGVSVLPLPAALTQMREVSHAESVSLIQRLDDFFSYRVVDLGGFAPLEFMAQVARAADHVWVVCDQSLGGVVSTAAMLRELGTRALPPERMKLVINQFDRQAGLGAQDIAQRLGLTLAHVVPARRAALLAAASRGEMLVTSARNDVYTQAVQAMARSLMQGEAAGGGSPEGAPVRSAWQALRARLPGLGAGGRQGHAG
ncbi:histidine kinase [Xenophilus arseniciresistens]|uniref:Histidine kinase n=1 Tax=Xenophilus arseniciresistens TaxID=1283306 RepID=A0AAE3T0J1_9BURK|nr:histidine kinase [Xenophilus arseniciresistens]MDA7418174.1 histidine kinase [Xenophilus arseniciresistens]